MPYAINSTLRNLYSKGYLEHSALTPDFCCFYGGGIRHNEDILHSFQNFIVRLIPNHPPSLKTRILKIVVRALLEQCCYS